jgi:nitrogen-specific signal transduction histidine kinase
MTASRPAGPSRSEPDAGLADLHAVLEQLPVGVLLLDGDSVVVHANVAASSYLGRPAAQLIGTDFFRTALPDLVGSDTAELADGKVVEVQNEAGERFLRVTTRTVPAGTELRLALIEDATALTEEKRRRRRAESLASVGQLAAGLAHEINNPLAAIKSFAQLLVRETSAGEHRHALELIIQESDRIGRAIENLVAFARQQGASGREPVNVSTLVERVIKVRRYSLEAAGIEVRLDLDASISPIMGEPGALQQVFLNLITRAETGLASRGADRMLIVRTRESSEGVVIYVVDNGPGIPREALPHLFDASFADTEGSGLELSTSARIIRDHGGYILAESEPGRGAAFFLRFPRAGAAPLSVPPEAIIPPAPQPQRVLRVLVADDEPTLRLAISLFLARRGHKVVQAGDAYEALRLARESDFDVALVDARMPGDGLALLEQLEAMPSLAGRTALMTGDLGRTRTTQGIPTGRPYLVKPFDMNEAVKLIEKLAEQESL